MPNAIEEGNVASRPLGEIAELLMARRQAFMELVKWEELRTLHELGGPALLSGQRELYMALIGGIDVIDKQGDLTAYFEQRGVTRADVFISDDEVGRLETSQQVLEAMSQFLRNPEAPKLLANWLEKMPKRPELIPAIVVNESQLEDEAGNEVAEVELPEQIEAWLTKLAQDGYEFVGCNLIQEFIAVDGNIVSEYQAQRYQLRKALAELQIETRRGYKSLEGASYMGGESSQFIELEKARKVLQQLAKDSLIVIKTINEDEARLTPNMRAFFTDLSNVAKEKEILVTVSFLKDYFLGDKEVTEEAAYDLFENMFTDLTINGYESYLTPEEVRALREAYGLWPVDDQHRGQVQGCVERQRNSALVKLVEKYLK